MEFSLYVTEFLVVMTAMVLALFSPGPDFAFILKQSVTYGKKTSIYTSLGLGFGVLFHALYSILGIGLVISKSIIAFNIIKFLGAFYLVYIGYKSLKSKGFTIKQEAFSSPSTQSFKKAFYLGFLCNALNPKAALFFISLFSVIVSSKTPMGVLLVYGIFASFLTVLWFSMLSMFLSQNRVRGFFNRFGKWFDRFMGVVLIGLGLRVAFMER